MNNTTTTTSSTNATVSYSLEYYYALFFNPVIVIRFYQIGYSITFLLGFIGNLASLITFSRSTLRKVSTGCLFIILAISDTLFLLMCVFDFLEFGLKVPFYGHVQYDELCRFRSFVMYVSQVLSSWILVTVSVDRWIRTRFPYKSGSICTPKMALIVVGVILIIDIGVHSHMLTPLYGMLIPGFSIFACGPTLYTGSYFIFYFLYWSVIQIITICLLPVTLMVLLLIDIIIGVHIRKRALIHPIYNSHGQNILHHQQHLQTQMFILMIASIFLFLITTLPVAIYKIISPRQDNLKIILAPQDNPPTEIFTIVSIWTGLGWLQSLNYATNFYSHCLTSTLFRKEFKQQIKFLLGDKQTGVHMIELTALGHAMRIH